MRLLPIPAYFSLALAVTLAQGHASPYTNSPQLTQQDKSAIADILNALGTRQGEELSHSVAAVLDAMGVDSQAVVRAVKFAAGPKLSAFQSVLTQICIGGQQRYCQLAALQAPAQDSEIQTGATGAGGAAGGDSGGGGSPQVNRGHTSPFSSSQNLVRHGALDSPFNIVPVQTPSSPVTYPGTTTSNVVAAPGPIAGVGLPAVMFACWTLWRRRRT